MVAIVYSIYSQSVCAPACGVGSWTTTLGVPVYRFIVFACSYMLTITITNYLFRQNRTRNITKVILITHTKISTLQRSCQGDCT